jgi:hypothetical protein
MGAVDFEMESGGEETLPDFKFGVPSSRLQVGDLSSDRSKSGQMAFFPWASPQAHLPHP